MMIIEYLMSKESYKKLLATEGIGNRENAIAYINNTYGLLGTVEDIVFEN